MPLSILNWQKRTQKGFTFIELIVVFGIITVLFSIGYIGVSKLITSTTSNTSISSIISDIKTQQIKAMVGDTEGNGTPDTHGVKILSNSYVLFHGSVYNAQSSSNFEIPIPEGYTLTTTFPDQTIVFNLGNGEIANYDSSTDTITLTNTVTNRNQSVEFNKFGAVTSISQ